MMEIELESTSMALPIKASLVLTDLRLESLACTVFIALYRLSTPLR